MSADGLTLDRHPKLSELQQKGCIDIDIALMATQVYLELTKVRKWHEVELCFSKELNVAYVTGYRPEDDDKQASSQSAFKVIVPVHVQRQLTFDDLKTFQRICPQTNGSVILGFVDQDLTIVYYELEEGIRNQASTNLRSLDVGSSKENEDNVTT